MEPTTRSSTSPPVMILCDPTAIEDRGRAGGHACRRCNLNLTRQRVKVQLEGGPIARRVHTRGCPLTPLLQLLNRSPDSRHSAPRLAYEGALLNSEGVPSDAVDEEAERRPAVLVPADREGRIRWVGRARRLRDGCRSSGEQVLAAHDGGTGDGAAHSTMCAGMRTLLDVRRL